MGSKTLISSVNQVPCDILGYELGDILWRSLKRSYPEDKDNFKNMYFWPRHASMLVNVSTFAITNAIIGHIATSSWNN